MWDCYGFLVDACGSGCFCNPCSVLIGSSFRGGSDRLRGCGPEDLDASACALARCHALRMESTSLPIARHETRLSDAACGHLVRTVGTECLSRPANPISHGPTPVGAAKMINTVASLLPPSAKRLDRSKGLDSQCLSAERPPRPPAEVRSSGNPCWNDTKRVSACADGPTF